MDASYAGECYKVIHCDGALKSLKETLKSVTPTNKQRRMLISLQLQIERLASGKRSSDLTIRKEGLLPSYEGKPAKHFWAIKKIPVRGYFWESERHYMTYYISHYIYKDFDRLDDSDVQRIRNNWVRIERDFYEY